jgi:RND superfamily putative drug exporter
LYLRALEMEPERRKVKGSSWTERLARACARRPWVTVGIWVVVMAVAVITMVNLLGDALVTDVEFTSAPESMVAFNLMNERLGTDETMMDEMVIVRSDTLTVDDPAFEGQVNGLYGELTALGPDVVTGAVTYYMVQDPSMVSADGHSTFIPFKMPQNIVNDTMPEIYALGDKYGTGDFEVFHTGNAAFMADSMKLSESTMKTGETIGITVALVVLAIVFGAVAAAFLPVLLGIAAIIAALGLTALVGQTMDLTFMITNMITMMGLAVGIDYSLFILTRYREERARGLAKLDAIGAAGATASRAIFFSGITVMLALTGLVIFPLSIFISMGIGALLVVFASIVASMTLLPALISIFGDKVNALRIPFIQRKPKALTHEEPKGFWAWTARTVTRSPVVFLVLTVAILGAAIVPFFDKKSGMSGISSVPDYLPSKQGFLVLQQDFHIGLDAPVTIVVDGNIADPATQAAMAGLQDKLNADPLYASVTAVPVGEDMSIIYARLVGDSMSTASMDGVKTIRAEYIPTTFADAPARAMVTGDSAFMVDYNKITNDYTPIIFVMVLALSFIVLLLAFRSVVISATAIAMNLLSVGAAYGLIVLVFQKGIGAGLFGFTQVDIIETWLPLFLFAVLFGLSMDYQVFLLSRVREHFKRYGDNTAAVAFGLRSTGRLITGAALIMVAVFGGFALGDMVMMQQMGFGLAIAVLIDSTLIRCVLVPATMKLLGKYNWYLPKWLEWLPNISLGESPVAEKVYNKPTVKPMRLEPENVKVEMNEEE